MTMTRYRGALFGSLACVLAAAAWVQQAPAQDETPADATVQTPHDADTRKVAAAPAADEDEATDGGEEEAASPAASKEDVAEQLRKEAQETAESERAPPAEGPESAGASQPTGKDEDSDFIPTEKIWADSAIAFPSDI
jgi:hypothetical protein